METARLSAIRHAIAQRVTRRSLLGRVAAGAVAGGALAATTAPNISAAESSFGRLGQLTGVSLIVEWNGDGRLERYESRGGHSREVAEQAATYGAVVSTMAPGFAHAYSRATEMRWTPFRAMVVYGGDWAVVIGNNNRGAWIDAAQANIDDVIEAVGQRHGPYRFRRIPRDGVTLR